MSRHGMSLMHLSNYRAFKHDISHKHEWLTYQKPMGVTDSLSTIEL